MDRIILSHQLLSIFPFQTEKNWTQLLNHFSTCIKSSQTNQRYLINWLFDKPLNLHFYCRKTVIQMNVLCSVLGILQSLRHKKQMIANATGSADKLQAILDFIQTYVSDPDASIRRAAAESFGLLASLQGDHLTEKLLSTVTNALKKSQDLSTRAGCGFVLGCIYRYVGGVSCSQHLPAIISLLHVLCRDPNPTVYVWALHSLYLTIESSGLSFSSFANPTLTLVFSLLLSKSFDSSLATANQGKSLQSFYSCWLTPCFHSCGKDYQRDGHHAGA